MLDLCMAYHVDLLSLASCARLGRRATEEQCERALKEHFPGWPRGQVDLVLVNGQSLRQRLTADIHARNAKQNQQRPGSSYWSEIRALYGTVSTTSLDYPFAVEDASTEVSQELIDALKAAKNPNTTVRSKAPLTALFGSVTALSQREFCGISRHMVTVRPSVSDSSLQLCLDFLRMIARLHLQDLYSRVWLDGLRSFADQVLIVALAGL